MESDHRTGFVDFDELELFRANTEELTHNTSRKLSTDYPESIEKYLTILHTKIKARKIPQAISKLQRIAAKSSRENHKKRYSRIDNELTTIMLAAEKKFVPTTTHPSLWSTNLEAATRAIRYWNMRILGYTKSTSNQELLNIEQTAGNVIDKNTTLQEAQAEWNQA